MSKPLPPLSTIGILGGGQLGRMMAMAAAEMGYHVHIYCPEQDCPASEVAKFTTVAAYDDVNSLLEFTKKVDVVTYEFENIPSAPVIEIAKHVGVFPSPQILATSQHRVLEKQAINSMGIATAPFAPISSADDLRNAVKTIGLPAILKTARMGYDGKGQTTLRSEVDVNKAIEQTSFSELSHILEGFVDFTMEISVLVARDASGNARCYCPVQNTHKNHILAETIAPAPISEKLAAEAEKIACTVAEKLDLVGLLAIEMFVTNFRTCPESRCGEAKTVVSENRTASVRLGTCGAEAQETLFAASNSRDYGQVLINELAPRPHNSGHWTMDAAITSQFEQAIRAVCGLPLGDPSRLCNARMINLIGDDVNDWQKYIAQPNAKIHLYGKKETKSGRKMGHVTFLDNN